MLVISPLYWYAIGFQSARVVVPACNAWCGTRWHCRDSGLCPPQISKSHAKQTCTGKTVFKYHYIISEKSVGKQLNLELDMYN